MNHGVRVLLSRLVTAVDVSKPAQRALERLLDRTPAFYGAGSELVPAGESPGHVHLLLDGWTAAQTVLSDGRRQILSINTTGDLVVPTALFARTADASVVALDGVRAVAVPIAEAQALMHEIPEIATAFAAYLAQEVQGLHDQLTGLGRCGANERVARLILLLRAKRAAIAGSPGTFLRVPLTQTLIADALGLSTVHVNRTVRGLERDGVVDWNRHEIRIRDLDALERLAEPAMRDLAPILSPGRGRPGVVDVPGLANGSSRPSMC